jgi:aryl-alcohol dehydrogenase-like predicted oxidoreductase
MKLLSISELHSLARCTAYQPQYNLLEREIEHEFVPICNTEGLGMVCWAPLAGGLLSGKYESSEKADGRLKRVSVPNTDSWKNRVNDFTLLIVKAVQAIAERRGVSCAQVALNWLRSKAWVTCPIIGARTFEQYCENIACLDWALDAMDAEALDRASERPAPYPYKYLSRLHRR